MPPPRAIIENAIEALIALLDVMDGDPDMEPDCDAERNGDTFMEPWAHVERSIA